MKRYNFELESVHSGEWYEIERVESESGAYVLHEDAEKKVKELELKLDQVKIGYQRLQNSSTEYDGGCMEIRTALGIV